MDIRTWQTDTDGRTNGQTETDRQTINLREQSDRGGRDGRTDGQLGRQVG